MASNVDAGNAQLDLVPRPVGAIVFLRRLDAKMMRLVQLDKPADHRAPRCSYTLWRASL